MRKWLLIGMTCLFFACKQKTPEQSGNTPMKITDFYKAFNTLPLPIIINDSTLDQIKEGYLANPKHRLNTLDFSEDLRTE